MAAPAKVGKGKAKSLCKNPAAAAGSPLVPAKDPAVSGRLDQRPPRSDVQRHRGISPPRDISWEVSL